MSYKQKTYRVRGAEGILSDLNRLPARYKQSVRRVFLADGNALAMPTTELVETLHVLKAHLPSLERVGVYGYAKDVRSKSIADLISIRNAGLGIVYLGLETGDDALLRWACKGIDSEENTKACLKIKHAAIPLSLTIILGLGGLGGSLSHAQKTSKVLNDIDPDYVGALTLMAPPGTRIFEMVQSGTFVPMKPMDILKELRLLVENLSLSDCIFRTNHASNYLALGGLLPDDKDRILSTIDHVIASDDESNLRPSYSRGL